MKIMAVCGHGLGSSFMLEMNIKKAIKALSVEDVEVDHSDLTSLTKGCADILVATSDIADNCRPFATVVSLSSILNKEEIKTKIQSALEEIAR